MSAVLDLAHTLIHIAGTLAISAAFVYLYLRTRGGNK